MTIRILLVDDHKVVRQGLRMFLGLEEDFEIVGEAVNGREAIEKAREALPDVILMDLLMPEMDGLAAITTIRKELPEIEVIALTSVLEDRLIYEAIRVGAIGYILKNTEPEELNAAIRAAYAGQVQLSPQVAQRLMREVRLPENPESLTEREMDVLLLLAQGLSNREIGNKLSIGEKTVKTHVSNILSKLNLPSRTQAALYALRQGLVPPLEGNDES